MSYYNVDGPAYSESELDSDTQYECAYCLNYMSADKLERHIPRKHSLCKHCNQRMPQKDLPKHIETHYTNCNNCNARIWKDQVAIHMQQCSVKCKYCYSRIPIASMGAHVEANHRRLFGITVPELNDDQCNKLIAENKLYVHNGRVYIK